MSSEIFPCTNLQLLVGAVVASVVDHLAAETWAVSFLVVPQHGGVPFGFPLKAPTTCTSKKHPMFLGSLACG